MWDWVRFFSGYKDDWIKCIPGCKKHHYSQEAKQALYEMKLIPDTGYLANAAPEYHRVCRIACDRHLQKTCTIIKSQSESNMAQHIYRKYSHSPGLVTLFR